MVGLIKEVIAYVLLVAFIFSALDIVLRRSTMGLVVLFKSSISPWAWTSILVLDTAVVILAISPTCVVRMFIATPLTFLVRPL